MFLPDRRDLALVLYDCECKRADEASTRYAHIPSLAQRVQIEPLETVEQYYLSDADAILEFLRGHFGMVKP